MRNIITVFLLLCIQSLAYSQNTTVVDSAELKREYNPANWQVSANFILFSPQGHQWFTQAVICSPEYSSLAEVYRFKLLTGYELYASEHWRFAFAAKVSLAEYSKYFFPRITLAHHGQLAKLDFIKEFNGEIGFNME